jgi:hypothetical protein
MMKKNRPLGFMEARMHLMQAELGGSTQAILAVALNGILDHSIFIQAVKDVSDQIEFLRSTIQENASELYYEVSSSFQPEIHVHQIAKADEWIQELNHQNNRVLDPTKALWRLHLLSVVSDPQQHFLFLVFHHAIIDAGTLDRILDQLLTTYSARFHERDSGTLNQQVTHIDEPINPAAEQLMLPVFTHTWEEFLADSTVRNKSLPAVLSHDRVADLEERTTKTEFILISKDISSHIEDYCSFHKSSVNSYLSACLLQTFHELYPYKEDVSLHSAFSLRRLCGVKDTAIGCYINVIPMAFAQGVVSLPTRELMKAHQEALSRAVFSIQKLPRHYELSAMKSSVASMASKKHFSCDMGFTHGVFTVKYEYDPLRVEFLCPTVNRRAANALFFVHGIQFANQIGISVSAALPSCDAVAYTRFISVFKEKLESSLHMNKEQSTEGVSE